jgi:glucose/arabinose dehydrogenase/PKD repeat protein
MCARVGALCLAAVAIAAAPARAAGGLVAAYGFNEGTGTAIADASGTGNNGTASGTTWSAGGRFGAALSFNGTDGSVTVPDSSSLDLSTGMTLEAWVNPNQLGATWRTAVFKQSTNGMVYSLYAHDGSRPLGQVNILGEQNASGTAQVPLNAWTHLATTYDGATLRLYVNGTQVASKPQTGTIPASTGPLRIGGNSIWSEWFRGLIDEVRVYNRALTAGEIQTDMTTPVGTAAPPAGPPPPQFVNDRVIIGIDEPTQIAWTPDGRMLIAERDGTIWVVPPGASQVSPTPLLQVPHVVTDNERGLLGLTLDPEFATNGYVYVYYTHDSLHNRVSRFSVTGNTASPASELVIWQNPAQAAVFHQGGDIHFGPDGDLYVSVGDHLTSDTAQSLTSYNGKILRMTRDGVAPTDNPFYDGSGPNLDAIWARGLRNPFRFTIDPATGRIIIADVGESTTEEVDIGVAGANYGWPICEGPCGNAGMTDPIYSYPHGNHDASITGGFVYRGSQFPAEYDGDYFFADYAMNFIKRLEFRADGSLAAVRNFEPPDGTLDTPIGDIVALQQGPDGALWYVDAGPFQNDNAGAIRRIRNATADQPPSAVAAANPTTGKAPLTVSFSSAGSSDPEGRPLTYSWDFGDGTTSTQANPTHTYARSGRFTVRLTTSDGALETVSDALTITAGSPPVPRILTPTDGASFKAGDVISFSGAASDPEDGNLPASALSWKIVFHHDDHIHPALDGVVGASGSMAVPDTGHNFRGRTNYEIVLTATDRDGIQASTSVTVVPQKVNLTFQSVPSGLTVTVDGIPSTTPFTVDEIVGFKYAVDTPSPQNGSTFASWSDGGAKAHTVTVPAANTTLTATFSAQPGNPIAAYNFDAGSGSTLTDVSGNNHPGTISGATWSTTGKTGRALSFDGINDSVSIADANDLDLTTAMTLEAWVRPSTLGNAWRTVVFKEQPSHMTYALYASTDTGRPTGQAYVGGQRDARATTALPVATWSHLAVTYDGTTVRLYVNGAQAATQAGGGPMATSTRPLKLGGNSVFGSEWYAGLIDDVRVYNRVLSAAQIQGDMTRAP